MMTSKVNPTSIFTFSQNFLKEKVLGKGFYTFKTYSIIKWLFPKYLWDKKIASQKTIYLTFDDGPTPVITEKVLEILKTYQAKATFFLIGKNAVEYPEIVKKILDNGHAIGNHTHNHLNGSKVNTENYIENLKLAETVLPYTRLFRPPYGRITKRQATEILKLDYKIVMWDVLSGDFDLILSPEKSFKKIIKHTSNGSIVVFHDSLKAERILLKVLPKALEHWSREGYVFRTI